MQEKGVVTMAYSEATKRATMKYLKEKTDDIRLRTPRGTKDRWREFAEARGMSMTQFVVACVEKVIEDA